MAILTDHNLNNLIEKLKKDGVIITKEDNQRIYDCVSFKSFERYRQLARTFEEEVSFSKIDQLYIWDIKLRRAFLRMSFFVEVFIRSTITNMFEHHAPEMKFMKDTLINERNYFKEDELFKNKSKLIGAYKKSKDKVLGEMEVLGFKKMINQMNFYGINNLFILLDSKNFVGTFIDNAEEVYASLDLIRKIRNASAHNEVLLAKYSFEEIEIFANAIEEIVPFIDTKELQEIKKIVTDAKEMYN